MGKALLDYGIHAPTVYFPLIIKEALLIEPTEGETRQDLNQVIAAFTEIAETAYVNADEIHAMPKMTGRGRLDEFALAKKPVLSEKQRNI